MIDTIALGRLNWLIVKGYIIGVLRIQPKLRAISW